MSKTSTKQNSFGTLKEKKIRILITINFKVAINSTHAQQSVENIYVKFRLVARFDENDMRKMIFLVH